VKGGIDSAGDLSGSRFINPGPSWGKRMVWWSELISGGVEEGAERAKARECESSSRVQKKLHGGRSMMHSETELGGERQTAAVRKSPWVCSMGSPRLTLEPISCYGNKQQSREKGGVGHLRAGGSSDNIQNVPGPSKGKKKAHRATERTPGT